MDPKDIEKYSKDLQDWTVEFVPKVLLAVAILFIGLWLINKILKLTKMAFQTGGFSVEIQGFLGTVVNVVLKITLVFIVASIVGVNTASFMALFAAAGLGIGLALQGSLGNFAAGIVILVFKPYRVDDWVEIQDKFGQVEDIQIFNTLVRTPGKKVLVIPNGQVIEGIVTNYSMKGNIRMELFALMPYNENYPKVRKLLLDGLAEIEGVLKDPAPEVGIEAFDSHSIRLSIRPYVEPGSYWEVHFSTYEMVKRVFHENDIKMAYTEGVAFGEIGG
ncbi:MAG: mechanosensitive ion channel protein [Bacteroidetes bacterium]|nr:MAG: mechanosensitive ion channel protein [Bacteroidota bacterium]